MNTIEIVESNNCTVDISVQKQITLEVAFAVAGPKGDDGKESEFITTDW